MEHTSGKKDIVQPAKSRFSSKEQSTQIAQDMASTAIHKETNKDKNSKIQADGTTSTTISIIAHQPSTSMDNYGNISK